MTKLEREKAALETATRRLERRLQRAETIIAFQKKVAELLGIPLKPLPSDEGRLMAGRRDGEPHGWGTAAACDALGVPTRVRVSTAAASATKGCAAGAATCARCPGASDRARHPPQ